jgi:surface antigen
MSALRFSVTASGPFRRHYRPGDARRHAKSFAGLLCALVAGLAVSGCALDFGRLTGSSAPAVADAPETTRSIAGLDRPPFTASDLSVARLALAEAFARGPDGTSVPWSNPETGASGTVMPTSPPRRDGSATCRDFLASRVSGDEEAWLRGTGCRAGTAGWQVRALTPMVGS